MTAAVGMSCVDNRDILLHNTFFFFTSAPKEFIDMLQWKRAFNTYEFKTMFHLLSPLSICLTVCSKQKYILKKEPTSHKKETQNVPGVMRVVYRHKQTQQPLFHLYSSGGGGLDTLLFTRNTITTMASFDTA